MGLGLFNAAFKTDISIGLSFVTPSSFVDYANKALQIALKPYKIDGDIEIVCMPKSNKRLIMIIGIAAGGAGLLLIIILIVVCSVRHCACCKK